VTESSSQGRGGSAKIDWRGECCIDALDVPRKQLLNALDGSAGVELDLSGVTRIDTAGLQLLLAFVLEMRGRGRQLLLTNPSDIFSQSARFAGLNELLGLQNA
jgi:anti-anti-sigma factor